MYVFEFFGKKEKDPYASPRVWGLVQGGRGRHAAGDTCCAAAIDSVGTGCLRPCSEPTPESTTERVFNRIQKKEEILDSVGILFLISVSSDVRHLSSDLNKSFFV